LDEACEDIDCDGQHQPVACEIGDNSGEGTDLWNMILALDKLDNRAKAIECAKSALKIQEYIENPHVEMAKRKLQKCDRHVEFGIMVGLDLNHLGYSFICIDPMTLKGAKGSRFLNDLRVFRTMQVSF